MRIWPFKRKPKPRSVIKDIKPGKPPLVERYKPESKSRFSKLFSRFRKKTEETAVKLPDFGEAVRRQRTKQKQQERFKQYAGPVVNRIKLGVRLTTAIAIVAVVLILGTVFVLHDKQVYVVSEIEVSGNKQISQQTLLDKLNYLKGKSMFSFSESAIESDLTKDFPYIKLAQVRKQLPGKISIEIEERYPAVAYINLVGVFLVDEERVVVSQLGLKDVATLSPDELVVISGFGDPNANYTREHYLSKIDDEKERKEVKWPDVPFDDKKQALNEYREGLLIRVDTTLNNNLTALLGSEFVQLPRLNGYDTQLYDIGSSFPAFKFDDSKAIQDYLLEENLPYAKMTWQSDFTVVADLANGIRLMFSSTRDIQDQLKALNTVRTQGDLGGKTLIDLRSELVAVR